ncbi:protein lin-52 homolog [Liolophura sinensis]|uniref:protein lin-52 homolog n=1 Tax=Liolophura sinensis TaxID=3198878 RepID=UPI003158B403
MVSPSGSADDLDQLLLSTEKLDRASPDLWPEKIPGVSEFAALKSPNQGENPTPKWMTELEKEDIDLLQEFGSLTTSQLVEKMKGLQNLAYQLGLEEAREMTRGKFLNILQKSEKR